MIDAIFERRPKRFMHGINIVPILDMMTTIIFFLLMSTSFIAYTKLTVPPSATATVSGDRSPPPLLPRMSLSRNADKSLVLKMSWQGLNPGESQKTVGPVPNGDANHELLEASRALAAEFSKDHPKEKTIQIRMGALVPYQNLVTLMDGVRPSMPDVVLISYPEARTGGGAEE